jgi:iron complex outermembrane receptor protein
MSLAYWSALARTGSLRGAVLLAFTLCCPDIALAEVKLDITAPPQQPPAIDNALQDQQSMQDIPGDVSFADSTQWSDERDENVKDVTDYIPGVFAQPRDGAESDRLSIRGSGLANIFQGSGLLVLQDGIPINMADGEFEFATIDPWLIQYAEVFPGANALQYGGSTFGGAIDFLTPTGATDPGYSIRGEAGSFDTYHGELSMGKTWQGGDLYAAATGFSQSGYRDQNDQDTSRFNANLGLQLSDNFTNRIYISHVHSDADIPGAVSLADIAQDPRQPNATNLDENYQRDLDITRVADKSAWQDGDNRIDTAVFYTYRMLDNPVTTYEFQNTNDMGVTAKYTHTFDLSKFMLGVDSYYGFGDETRYQDRDASPGALLINRNLSAVTNEAYAELDQHLAGKLYGILDVQGALDTRDVTQTFPYNAQQNERYGGFNPRIGLRYDYAFEKQLFANLSRSFEPPTWSDLVGNNPGFTDLKAQRATTAEAGTRWVTGDIHWQAAYYHGWLHDELVNYRFADGDTATINAPRSKRDGVELGAQGDVWKNLWAQEDALSLRAAYTFSYFTLDHDPVFGNNIVPGVPEHYIRAELLYRHPSGISLGPNVEWSPTRSPVDLANTLYADSYALLGFRTFWQSSDDKLSIYLEGRNLLNTSYAATYNVVPDAEGHDGNYFYPGEGRAVYAGFKWKM